MTNSLLAPKRIKREMSIPHPERADALSRILCTNISKPLNPGQNTNDRIALFSTNQYAQGRLSPAELNELKYPGAWKSPGKDMYGDAAARLRYKEYNEKFWYNAFAFEYASLDDYTPWRVRVVYRIIREMALVKGLCTGDERLAQALMIDPDTGHDPYVHPTAPYPTRTRGYSQNYFAALKASNELPEVDRVWWHNHDEETAETHPVKTAPGLGLCPPPVPLTWMVWDENGRPHPHPDYDPENPEHDPALHLFMELVRGTVDFLNLGAGTANDPEAGFKGLQGLLSPTYIRMSWPTKVELLTWELEMVKDATNCIIKMPTMKGREYIINEYGLTESELNDLLQMARAYAKQITEKTLDEERGIQILRIEQNVAEAIEALDHKGVLNNYKQLAMITGLTRADVEDQMTEFLQIAKKASAKAAKNATHKVLKAALGPKPLPVAELKPAAPVSVEDSYGR